MGLPYLFSSQASKETTDIGAIQKAADFVQAFMLGFEVEVNLFILLYHFTIAIL